MRQVAKAVCAFLLIASALAVLTAGPLTSNAAVTIVSRIPDAARVLTAIAITL